MCDMYVIYGNVHFGFPPWYPFVFAERIEVILQHLRQRDTSLLDLDADTLGGELGADTNLEAGHTHATADV